MPSFRDFRGFPQHMTKYPQYGSSGSPLHSGRSLHQRQPERHLFRRAYATHSDLESPIHHEVLYRPFNSLRLQHSCNIVENKRGNDVLESLNSLKMLKPIGKFFEHSRHSL